MPTGACGTRKKRGAGLSAPYYALSDRLFPQLPHGPTAAALAPDDPDPGKAKHIHLLG